MGTSRFEDHFSHASVDYAVYRPVYPGPLFEWLASIAPGHGLAWDCATGNGQAALALAPLFERVIASDASAAQIGAARAGPENLSFRVFPAEAPDLDDASVDLITVAQALHWFDHDRFFEQALRVLVSDGVLAAWCYERFQIDPAVDDVIETWYRGPLDAYWPAGRRHIEASYRTIPFPLAEIDAPVFEMTAEWRLENVLGYLGTWSAVKRYREANREDPLALIRGDLTAAWGEPERVRRVCWPLTVRVGSSPH